METHSHTLVKKWPHYLWDFLMLFLAMTLGFFVENKRELYVEHQKEKEFIKSYIEDLENDHNQYNKLITQLAFQCKTLDTLLTKIKGITSATGANGIYKYLWSTTGYPDFIYTDRTIEQLKNSGGFRMIEDKTASARIIKYDAMVKRMQISLNTGVDPELLVLRHLQSTLFDLSCCPEIGNLTPTEKIRFPDPGQLLTYDKKAITQYYNEVLLSKTGFALHKAYLEILKKESANLISLLKEIYQIKDRQG